MLTGFEEHVPLADRWISTKAVRPNGLYLSALRDHFSLGRRPIRRSMLHHLPGKDLRTIGAARGWARRGGGDYNVTTNSGNAARQ